MKFILLTATANAGQDLFSEAWTEGNLYQIQGLVSKLGSFACTLISIVGFGIVIFSILKNAMSGLYVVNPTFWDRVDEIKQQAISGMQSTITEAAGMVSGKGNFAAQKVGGIFTFLLGLVPNIKALTDFDDGVPVDKKQYFMKSIPLLIMQIFIGMMIFFGYPAKIAEWMGSAATYAIAAIINNVDPIEVVQGVSQKFTIYNLSTDGSQKPIEQTINRMASEMLPVVATKYNDMKKQPTQETALALEAELINNFSTDNVIMQILGAEEGYDVTISATSQSNTPTISAGYEPVGSSNVYYAQASNGTYSFKFWVQGSTLPTGSKKVGADDYFVWTVLATPVAVSNTSTANLIVFGGINTTGTVKNNTVSYTLYGITIGSNSGTDLKGTAGQNLTVEFISKADGTIQKSYTAILQTASVNQSAGATPVLTFNRDDRQDITNLLNTCYARVNLTGSWSFDVKDTSNDKNKISLKVTELRLSAGTSTMTGALSTWTDVDMTTSSGTQITYGMTKKSKMN